MEEVKEVLKLLLKVILAATLLGFTIQINEQIFQL